MGNINESDEKKFIDLLEEQNEIKETITRAIETIEDQKRRTKFNAKQSLKACQKELQEFKFKNFNSFLSLLKDCDKFVLSIQTMGLQVIKHVHQANDANFNKKVQSIVDAESDHVYSQLKSYNDAFFEKIDSDSSKLIQGLRKFVIYDKNEDELSVQIEKLELQKKNIFSMLGELTKVNKYMYMIIF